MKRPDLPAGTGLALGVLAVLAVIAVLGSRSEGGGAPVAPSLVALSPLDGRSPSEPAGTERRVLVELPRPALADRSDLGQMTAQAQRDYVASLKREARALRSALGARGVALRDVVAYGRTWDGFAATVDTSDLAALSSLGVRAQPVRRFYPAASEPVPVPGATPTTGGRRGAEGSGGAPRPGAEAIAILDTGADVAPGGGVGGYDAPGPGADPPPGTDPPATPRPGGPR